VLALAAAAIVAVAVVFALFWAAQAIRAEIAAAASEAARGRALQLLTTFAPATAAAQADPRAILVWHPIARAARALFPEDFAAIDRALGATFPFSSAQLQASHAQWTADWLAWERTHDAEYKRRAAAAERDAVGEPPAGLRARIEAIESEKLDLYQRRYEEYVRVAKALQAVQN
jgi:hypothetical protein